MEGVGYCAGMEHVHPTFQLHVCAWRYDGPKKNALRGFPLYNNEIYKVTQQLHLNTSVFLAGLFYTTAPMALSQRYQFSAGYQS